MKNGTMERYLLLLCRIYCATWSGQGWEDDHEYLDEFLVDKALIKVDSPDDDDAKFR